MYPGSVIPGAVLGGAAKVPSTENPTKKSKRVRKECLRKEGSIIFEEFIGVYFFHHSIFFEKIQKFAKTLFFYRIRQIWSIIVIYFSFVFYVHPPYSPHHPFSSDHRRHYAPVQGYGSLYRTWIQWLRKIRKKRSWKSTPYFHDRTYQCFYRTSDDFLFLSIGSGEFHI